MESIGANSSAVQLRKLCVHILGPDAPDEVLSSQFRSALQVLSTSTSGQENVRDNEFVVAERIKKLLVRISIIHKSICRLLQFKFENETPFFKKRCFESTRYLLLSRSGISHLFHFFTLRSEMEGNEIRLHSQSFI